jgi:hypothetical protein
MTIARQIGNARNRVSRTVCALVKQNQTSTPMPVGGSGVSERGLAANAASFAQAALLHLENGDYDRFLTNLRIAGEFAADATTLAYKRSVR